MSYYDNTPRVTDSISLREIISIDLLTGLVWLVGMPPILAPIEEAGDLHIEWVNWQIYRNTSYIDLDPECPF